MIEPVPDRIEAEGGQHGSRISLIKPLLGYFGREYAKYTGTVACASVRADSGGSAGATASGGSAGCTGRENSADAKRARERIHSERSGRGRAKPAYCQHKRAIGWNADQYDCLSDRAYRAFRLRFDRLQAWLCDPPAPFGPAFFVRFSWVLLTAPLAYQALWASVQEMPETMAATAAMTSKIRIAV